MSVPVQYWLELTNVAGTIGGLAYILNPLTGGFADRMDRMINGDYGYAPLYRPRPEQLELPFPRIGNEKPKTEFGGGIRKLETLHVNEGLL